MKIEEETVVTVILQNPREKIWGVLREINPAGVFVRGIDLNVFEDFLRAVSSSEVFYGLGEHFFPLWRVEKVVADEANGDVPALSDEFARRAGKHINEF